MHEKNVKKTSQSKCKLMMIIDDFVEKIKENEYDWFLVATKMG